MTAKFKGNLSKGEFYLLLDYMDRMKSRGFYFIKHERKDQLLTIDFDYELKNESSIY